MQARGRVIESAEWYVYSHWDLLKYLKRSSVAVIGSGAWACAAARMVAQNTASGAPGDEFVEEVKMWVFEEDVGVWMLLRLVLVHL
jgi:glycerol-3-phosphate dehydrogenase (NAD+)